jgi:branched-chain amino acid transport system substrate-binding protein
MKGFVRKQVVVFAVLVLALSVSPFSSAQAADAIKIGGLFELTGFLAPIGKDARQGAMVAIEQAGGTLMGRPLEFITEDSATDVPTSMDKMRKLVEVNKVRIIVGPIFGGSQDAMGGYADKMRVPVITIPSGQNSNILKNKWTFSAAGTDESNGYPMGVYAAEKLGYKTATTIGSDFEAGHEFIRGFALGFESKGGKILQQQWYPPGTTNMIPYLVAAKNKADCLVTWWPGRDAFAGFKQYQELNIKMPIVQPEDGGITGNPVANKHLGNAVVGAHSTVLYSYLAKTTGNKEFVAAYKKKYGVLPSPLAGAGYVSTQIAMEAIKKAGPDSSQKELKKALIGLKMDTIHGPLNFNQWRIATYTTPIVKISPELVPEIVAQYRVISEVVNGKIKYSLED